MRKLDFFTFFKKGIFVKNVIDIMLNCVTNVKEYNPLLRRFIDIETTCSSEKCHIQNCVYCTLNNVICTER